MTKNSALIALSESDRTQFGRLDFAAQDPEQKVFSAIWTLESEVNNGGFAQYFENAEPDAIAFAPAALQAIGAHQCADIVTRALPYASEYDRDKDDAVEILMDLDEEFLAYPDNLIELLYAYVVAHPATFGQLSS